ncbi:MULTISPECIES: LD-carboxypeptidase [Streptomyces]|uniref:LD-carboxypeptidase n=1 Tax=Streptomyces TaxID=1883 RepID=UPI0038705B39
MGLGFGWTCAARSRHGLLGQSVQVLTSWGLRAEDRVSELNSAFRDPGVRAALAAMGGKRSYRIVDDLDDEGAALPPAPGRTSTGGFDAEDGGRI